MIPPREDPDHVGPPVWLVMLGVGVMLGLVYGGLVWFVRFLVA